MHAPDTTPSIRSVRVGTTGVGSMHPEHRYGSRLPPVVWALLSRRWIDGVPLHFFAIDHRDGLVLFDTGLDPAIADDPREYLGSALGVFFINRLFRWHIRPEDNVRDQFTLMGHDVAAVRTVVFSHLHFDHTGCIEHLLHARLLAPRCEWQALTAPNAERSWYLRQHVDRPGAQWTLLDAAPSDDPDIAPFRACYDVMGDRLPGVADDFEAMRASNARVRALRERLTDLMILPSHDIETAARLAAAPPA